MLFGSDEMKELLLNAAAEKSISSETLELFYGSVYKYSEKKIRSGFKKDELYSGSKALTTDTLRDQDIKDIVNDVVFAVFKKFDEFLHNLNKYNEKQRTVWLKTIVYRRIASYFKQGYNRSECMDEIKDTADTKYVGIRIKQVDEDFQLKETLKTTVRIVCTAPYKPEKILAFLYNEIVFREKSAHEKNGDATETCDFMNGKTLYELNKILPHSISNAYGVNVADCENVLLTEKLGDTHPTELGMKICKITPKMVTDWTYRVKTYMYKFIGEFYGEGTKK